MSNVSSHSAVRGLTQLRRFDGHQCVYRRSREPGAGYRSSYARDRVHSWPRSRLHLRDVASKPGRSESDHVRTVAELGRLSAYARKYNGEPFSYRSPHILVV